MATKFHFFTDIDLIQPQNVEQAFGRVLLGHPDFSSGVVAVYGMSVSSSENGLSDLERISRSFPAAKKASSKP